MMRRLTIVTGVIALAAGPALAGARQPPRHSAPQEPAARVQRSATLLDEAELVAAVDAETTRRRRERPSKVIVAP